MAIAREFTDDQLTNEIDDLSNVEAGVQRRLTILRDAKGVLKQERIRRGGATRSVSDHAIVRYLERCKGVDIEALREVLRRMAKESIPAKDGEHHWHSSGVALVIGQDGHVVTVLGPDQITKWLGRPLSNGTRATIVAAEPPAAAETRGLV